jgi:hypothetical protein
MRDESFSLREIFPPHVEAAQGEGKDEGKTGRELREKAMTLTTCPD